MGQIQMNSTPRIPYEENSDNGLVLCDKYIPEELIAEILCYVDHKSLSNCQLVCIRWRNLLQDYVWRKKAEYIIGQLVQSTTEIPWTVYCTLCKKNPIGRNLLKNNSGCDGLLHWQINNHGGDHWKSESPPVGVPSLHDNPVFEGKNCCFVTSYAICSKQQIIDLVKEGLSPLLLDTLQPSVLVGEWYSARWDCPAIYECTVGLLDEDNTLLDTYHFRESIADERQNVWHHFEHEFKGYGPGLRKIVFQHSGQDTLFWAGHYGSKMTGASVVIRYKSHRHEDNSAKEGNSNVDKNSSRSTVQLRDDIES